MKTYLKFIELKSKIKFFCDSDCERLLELIALRELNGNAMTVKQAMESGFVSPATIHRKLGLLRDVGYVKTVHQDLNRRTKFFKLTPMGKSYFSSVEAAMILAEEQTK